MLNYQRVDHLEKYEFVNWDDSSIFYGKINPHVPNHQPDSVVADWSQYQHSQKLIGHNMRTNMYYCI